MSNGMESQILAPKRRKQFDVLAAAPQLTHDLSSRAAARMEVVMRDWWVVDFMNTPIEMAACEAGRER